MNHTGGEEKHPPKPNNANLNPGSNNDEVITFIMKGIKERPTAGNRNNFAHIIASECNRFGVNENDAYHHLLQYQEKDFTASEIRTTVHSAYQRINEHATKAFTPRHQKEQLPLNNSVPNQHEEQIPKPKSENTKNENRINKAIRFLSNEYKNGDIVFNDLNKKLVIRDGEELETVYINLKKHNIDINKNDLYDLLKTEFAIRYDPISKYFDGLRNQYTFEQVNGSIRHLCTFVKAKDQDFFYSMLRKHLIRAVGQGMVEAINRFVFVIQQYTENTGKSSFIRFLNPFGAEDLYAEKIPQNDPILILSQVLMVNIDELESFTKKDVDWLKSVISVRSDQVRIYYSQIYETRHRRASLWGSTNKIEFLADGENTRWIICEVESIDFDYNNTKTGIRKVDINRVWAEAVHLYDLKADMQPTPDEWIKMSAINKEYIFQNDHDLIVEEYLMKSESPEDFTTLPVIAKYLNDYKGMRVSPQKMGTALIKGGFTRQRRNAGKGYLVLTIEGENIKNFLSHQTFS